MEVKIMPRSARITLGNSCYHIITRGNQRQNIFGREYDYNKYLDLLKKYKHKYRFWLYAYCLMPNHVHLLIEPDKHKQLSKIMHGLNLSYTIWFNKTYNKVGHLYQDRFKSMIIQKDEYLLSCINYIELNPVRAGITEQPEKYGWSSYFYRISGKKSEILDCIKF